MSISYGGSRFRLLDLAIKLSASCEHPCRPRARNHVGYASSVRGDCLLLLASGMLRKEDNDADVGFRPDVLILDSNRKRPDQTHKCTAQLDIQWPHSFRLWLFDNDAPSLLQLPADTVLDKLFPALVSTPFHIRLVSTQVASA